MDNYSLTDLLKERHGKEKRPKVLSVGPAGGNQVKFAGICNDKNDFIGRTGTEAVMGSKRLKAIVVTCAFCPIAGKRMVKVDDGPFKTEEGPGPEYETCCTFGTLIMDPDLAGVIKADEWCNRYGMDTISCRATIAFAMEAFEKGLLTLKDTDGIDLTWGNIAGVIELLHKIAKKEGN